MHAVQLTAAILVHLIQHLSNLTLAHIYAQQLQPQQQQQQ
jgi:hypothetical protein